MILDATITIEAVKPGDAPNIVHELLYPARHRLTLPLNGLNNIFHQCEVAFNYHNKLNQDR
jgi:hypothetical protein